MNEEKIIRVETYKKIQFINKQYLNLPQKDFPCVGAEAVCRLFLKIIEKLLERFSLFSLVQLQLINTSLIPFFEKMCGHLDDSRTNNVPWSIIPSLENLFSKIKPDNQFVICPIWETNYSIINRNIIEYVDTIILSIPGFLFDDPKSIASNRKEFLKEFPSGIYFVLYPRTERLSVLHFPLLGHELGHIYSAEWLKVNFEPLLKKHGVKEKVQDYVKSKLPKEMYGPLFREPIIDMRSREIIAVFKRIFAEILSDIFGIFIFGHATLLSTYLFALRSGLDDFGAVEGGYLSYRFRLHFLQRSLEFMDLKNVEFSSSRTNTWIESIYNNTNLETNNYDYKAKNCEYIGFIIDVIEKEFDNICQGVSDFLGDHQYKKTYSEELQEAVIMRLNDGIIPNCILNEELDETPIDLRNIVGGTWQYYCENNQKNHEEFYEISLNANLLSLKAIELSYLQERFQKKQNDT